MGCHHVQIGLGNKVYEIASVQDGHFVALGKGDGFVEIVFGAKEDALSSGRQFPFAFIIARIGKGKVGIGKVQRREGLGYASGYADATQAKLFHLAHLARNLGFLCLGNASQRHLGGNGGSYGCLDEIPSVHIYISNFTLVIIPCNPTTLSSFRPLCCPMHNRG